MAARLSRYLQVLTQAKKMGRETISSQELADYTHVNSTQIRRDLSGFGKFGKRGVGYNVDALVSQIRKILRTTGKHNIALFGAGNLGQAIAGSDIFADHGFRLVALFDTNPSQGRAAGERHPDVRRLDDLERVVREEDVVVGVLAVPTEAAQQVADDLVQAGVKIIFNYSEALLGCRRRSPCTPRARPSTSSTRSTSTSPRTAAMLDMPSVREVFEASTDFTVGIEEEFGILDPDDPLPGPALRRAEARRAGGSRPVRVRWPAS